jgi:hypothetical protein
MFGYINKFTIWRADNIVGNTQICQIHKKKESVELKEYSRFGWYRNWCRTSITCTPKEFVNMSRCFWEERLSKISIYKNNVLLNHFLVILIVGSHLEALYGFWKRNREREYISKYSNK